MTYVRRATTGTIYKLVPEGTDTYEAADSHQRYLTRLAQLRAVLGEVDDELVEFIADHGDKILAALLVKGRGGRKPKQPTTPAALGTRAFNYQPA